MNNNLTTVYDILADESSKLDSRYEANWERVKAIPRNTYIVPFNTENGVQEKEVERIVLDEMTPEKRVVAVTALEQSKDLWLKRYVFREFVEKLVPNNIKEKTMPYSDDLLTSQHLDYLIKSGQKLWPNCVDISEDNQLVNGQLSIGGEFIPVPIEMSYEEYKSIYTNALKQIIAKAALKEEKNPDDVIVEAATKVYLSTQQIKTYEHGNTR